MQVELQLAFLGRFDRGVGSEERWVVHAIFGIGAEKWNAETIRDH